MLYREVRPDGKRTFHLNGDTLSIRGSTTLRSSFELTIRLANADPASSLLWVRPQIFFVMIFMALASLVGSVVVWKSGWSTSENLADILLLAFSGALFVLSIFFSKKIKFTQFRNKSGVVLFDVAQAGPDRLKYNEFIEEIRKSIPTS